MVSKQKSQLVCGVPTQVVCTAFSSHILVVVTQFGKMGTLVALEPGPVTGDVSKPVLTTRVLLGQDEVRGGRNAPLVPPCRTLVWGCSARVGGRPLSTHTGDEEVLVVRPFPLWVGMVPLHLPHPQDPQVKSLGQLVESH